MLNKLTSPNVLALNANWQAIDVYTAQKAFCMMASGAAAGIDTSFGNMIPILWDKWVLLNTESESEAAMTSKGPIRIPRVVITVNYKSLKMKTDSLTHETIARKQNYRCAYSGKEVKRKNWSLDHIIPKSKGGSSKWDNLVIADKEINNKKADRTPEEAGLTLLHKPQAPKKMLPADDIRSRFGVLHKEWAPFIKSSELKTHP